VSKSPEGRPEPGATEARASYELAELVATSRALASERDINKLLAVILLKCRQVTGADAGSVYVIEEEDASIGEYKPAPKKLLHFMQSQNDSIKIDFNDFKIDIDDKSIVGQAVLGKQPINIPDLAKLDTGNTSTRTLRHNRSFDEKSGYRARSMLTVPLLSAVDEVIGVVQLINKRAEPNRPLGDDGKVVAFDQRSEELALAWAAMAGIALENALLYDEIRVMFDGFVDA
jgi:GAF domain-containing protein